jgi:hypothetical protein
VKNKEAQCHFWIWWKTQAWSPSFHVHVAHETAHSCSTKMPGSSAHTNEHVNIHVNVLCIQVHLDEPHTGTSRGGLTSLQYATKWAGTDHDCHWY